MRIMQKITKFREKKKNKYKKNKIQNKITTIEQWKSGLCDRSVFSLKIFIVVVVAAAAAAAAVVVVVI